jgi:hypothetical protein
MVHCGNRPSLEQERFERIGCPNRRLVVSEHWAPAHETYVLVKGTGASNDLDFRNLGKLIYAEEIFLLRAVMFVFDVQGRASKGEIEFDVGGDNFHVAAIFV